MAKTPAQIAALDTYTDAEMLKLVRWAIAELVSNPDQATVSVAGRQYGQQDLAKLQELERYYASNAARSAGTNQTIRLGAFQ